MLKCNSAGVMSLKCRYDASTVFRLRSGIHYVSPLNAGRYTYYEN